MVNAVERYTQSLTRKYLQQINAGRSANKPAGIDYARLLSSDSLGTLAPNSSSTNPTGIHKLIDIMSQPVYAAAETGKEVAADIYKGLQPNSSIADRLQAGWAPILSPFSFLGNFGTGNQKKAWSDVLRGNPEYLNSFNQRAGINKTVTEERGPLALSESARKRLEGNTPKDIADQNFASQLFNGLKASVTSGGEVGWKFAAGLAADILGDPSTYIGVGAVGATGRAATGAIRATETGAKALDAVSAAVKSTKTAKDAAEYSYRLGAKQRPSYAKDILDQLDGDASKAGRQSADNELQALDEGIQQDFGAQLLDNGNFSAPARNDAFTPLSSIEHVTPDEFINYPRRSVLDDTVSGESLTKSEKPGWQRAQVKELDYPGLDIKTPFYDVPAKPSVAEQVLKVAEPPAEIAMRTQKTAAQVYKRNDFLSANVNTRAELTGEAAALSGLPWGQINRIATDAKEATRNLRSLGYKTVSDIEVKAWQRTAKKAVDSAFSGWKAEQTAGLDAARQATIAQMPFEQFVAARQATNDPIAKRFMAMGPLKKAGDPKALKIIADDEKVLRRAWAEHAARQSEQVKLNPGLVARRTGPVAQEQAQRAAEQGARAARQARSETASRRRWSGVVYNNWLREVKRQLSPIDAYRVELAVNTGETQLKRVLKDLAKQKTGGRARFVERDTSIINTGRQLDVPGHTIDSQLSAAEKAVAKDSIIQARQQANTAEEIYQATERSPEQIEALRSALANGDHMSDSAKQAFYAAAVRQGWAKVDDVPEKFRAAMPVEEEFRYVSGKGAQRTEKAYGAGLGRWPDSVNSHMIENMWDGLWRANKKGIDAIRSDAVRGGRGKFEAARTIYEKIMYPQMKEIEEFLAANKIYTVATNSREGVPIYFTQVLDSLMQTEKGQEIVYGRIMDLYGREIGRFGKSNTGGRFFLGSKEKPNPLGEGNIPVSSLMNLGGFIVKMAETSDVPALLKLSGDFKAAANRLAQEVVSNWEQFEKTARGFLREGVYQDIAKGATREPISAMAHAERVKELYDVLTDPTTVSRLFEHVNRNVADGSHMFGAHVQSVSAQGIKQIMDTLKDASGRTVNSDKVESILFPERVMKTIDNDPTVAQLATDNARNVLGEVIPPVDIIAADMAKKQSDLARKVETTATKAERNNLGQTKYEENFREAMLEDGGKLLKEEDDIEYAMQTYLFRSLDFLSRRFIAKYDNATLHTAIREFGSLSGVLSRGYMKELGSINEASKKLAAARGLTEPGAYKEVAKEAFDNAKFGIAEDQIAADAIDLTNQMRNIVDYIFSIDKAEGTTQSILGVWFREGFDIDHINSKLSQSRFGLDESFHLEKEGVGEPLLTKTGKQRVRQGKPLNEKRALSNEEIAQQWKAWDIKDPIEFLQKMERVTTEVATEVAIAREAARLAKVHGLLSTKTRPGFVEVSREGFGKDSIFKYLPQSPTGQTFVHRDLLREMSRMDGLLKAAQDGNSGYRHWLRQNLDPLLAMWKAGMTIWRPGHHFRNIIGDSSMSFLENGTKNPLYYARALHMVTVKPGHIGTTFRGDYGVWDAAAAMQGIGRAAEQGAFTKELGDEILLLTKASSAQSRVIAHVNIGGQRVGITEADAWRGFMNRGTLPDFKKYEDIIDVGGVGETSTQRIAKLTNFEGSTGQKAFQFAHEKLANVSEGRDDWVRLADALSMMENGVKGKKSWASLDEMFDDVAAAVRRAHPDGSDLTPFEKNVMRRVVPFYSWNRKAIPLVLENILTHPGRFLAYPKAMYNFGESMGVDLESLSYPFPEDQMFPDFVTDKMTGIGWKANNRYFSFDVGFANADVTNMLFANGGSPAESLVSGAAGMLNPAIKIPIELQTGSQLNSGIPISDISDYIDSNTPGFNYVNSILGYSPSSIAENLLKGDVGIDRNRSVERGNRGGVTESPEYLTNFITGSKVLDTSKPNYITLARLQMIDRMRQERNNAN